MVSLPRSLAYMAIGGVEKRSQLAAVFDQILKPSECQACIELSERKGYEQALVNTGGGTQQLITDVRSSDRCIIDNDDFATLVWGRLKDRTEEIQTSYPQDFHMMALDKVFAMKPSDGKLWKAYNVNERFRYLKYTDGHYFKPHYDGSYQHSETKQSFTTVMLYLNDTKEGSGYTTLFTRDGRETHEHHVQPMAGSALIFQHNVKHAGGPVLPGDVKYAIRTDIMYTTEGVV